MKTAWRLLVDFVDLCCLCWGGFYMLRFLGVFGHAHSGAVVDALKGLIFWVIQLPIEKD